VKAILLLIISASLAAAGTWWATSHAISPSSGSVGSASPVIPCTYLFYINGSNYLAKNCTTGQVDYSGTTFSTVFTSTMTAGGSGLYFLRKGTYTITSQLSISSDSVTICGETPLGTVLREANGLNLQGVIYSSNHNNIRICNLQIDGNGSNQSGTNADIVSLFITGNFQNVTVDSNYLHDGKAGNIHIRIPGGGGPGTNHGVRILNNIVGKSYSNADSADNIFLSNSYDSLIQGNTVIGSSHIGIIGGSGGDYGIRIVSNSIYVTASFAGIFEDGNFGNYLHDVTVSDNSVWGTGVGNGIEVGFAVEKTTISSNTINGTLNGVRILSSRDITLTGNSITYSQRFGIEIFNSTDVTVSTNVFRLSARAGNAYSELSIEGGSGDMTITGNTLDGARTGNEYGILVDTGQAKFIENVTITSNIFRSMLEAVRLLQGRHYTISDNMVSGSIRVGIHLGNETQSLVTGNSIIGNGSGGSYSGIVLESTAGGNVITGNISSQNTYYGIEMNLSGKNIVVANDLRFNTTGPFTGSVGTDMMANNMLS